ncbi:conserved Plasmodium protein, unknown function [Plasmodium gallinaceum]|uniref:CS domain-containing protein n=1 Tax=Plasmodium gallinaceum TaxID=5849 RepID=A0A1J1GP75_PLAGA|nr:conserved Plasmodium protein, unknown function [Plasmodium gallinaceum]CRG94295.1 conserved Plasmodium protein, unknown function [Plasmodium gallinaceum]
MSILWIFIRIYTTLILFNHVIGKYELSLNHFFQNKIHINSRKKNNNYLYYFYNIKKKYSVKNNTKNFNEKCFIENSILKKVCILNRISKKTKCKEFYFNYKCRKNNFHHNNYIKYEKDNNFDKSASLPNEDNSKAYTNKKNKAEKNIVESNIQLVPSSKDELKENCVTNERLISDKENVYLDNKKLNENNIREDNKQNEQNINDEENSKNAISDKNNTITSDNNQKNNENFEKAMKRAENYIKGKEDDIIQKREESKKKMVIKNMKEEEDVFSDKLLDLRMYDILKYVYKDNIYSCSKNLVDVIFKWMKNTYISFLKSNEKKKKKKGEEDIRERDISNDYDKYRKEKYLNNFFFDKSDENDKNVRNEIETLKLYNKKNLSKYFFSFNKGNILKQLVTEGEDELIEDKKKEKNICDESDKKYDKKIEKILSHHIFNSDENYYIDKNRYMKSNVTVEFNIYDTYSDTVILNNKKTNSTMLEFPLIYSHHIIQKCILTMKKLEKSIFYIKNNLLFKNFSYPEEPANNEEKSIYDVITNENWIKMEIYLCNIYGMNENWIGITPEMFSDEEKSGNFLKEYSIDSSNNLINLTSNENTVIPNIEESNRKDNTEKEDSKNINEKELDTKNAAIKETENKLSSNNKNSLTEILGNKNESDKTERFDISNEKNNEKINKRREEIIRRSEEYEKKKELDIKTDFLLKKLENEMKYNPNHYMWDDLYPQLNAHHKKKTDKYFDDLKKEMSENKYSRGYTENIKKKQSLKGYDLGETIEGITKYYIWKENIHSFSLYFPLRPYVKKNDIFVDIDNNFFFLSIFNHTIIKDFFSNPINSSDSVWLLSDNENKENAQRKNKSEYPVYEINNSDDHDIQKIQKTQYCLIYNIYKDSNHKYMWGSIFKKS